MGVDGSPSSVQALRWALDQAELTGAAVQAVSAWEAHAGQRGNAQVYPDDDPAERAAVGLSEAIGEAATGRTSVEISHRIVEGHPADVLIEAARNADILVMGNRGHGRFTGALVGSVTQRCIQHAGCPVVVIRAEDPDDDE
ncbi:universal stress protein [Glycomyces sp. YM15]|uniref:universal stress protein n=1 Tax=Glycomyces sp. YM15 TaxID=2800446 RepID=UPI0027DCD4C8|nr:universal stress protein [Glycomyces sp. YM15]